MIFSQFTHLQVMLWRMLLSLVCALFLGTSGGVQNVSLIWDTDSSSVVVTPVGIIRGKPAAPVGNNGHAVNIYGNKGVWPRINADNSTVNGGVPQLGNFTQHALKLSADLQELIPDANFSGICLLDYEQWRADWNTTGALYREKSINLTHGNVTRAKEQYEAAAKTWFLRTIDLVQTLRPGCRCGWYAYPSNALPHLATPTWRSYCQANPAQCWFDKGGEGGVGDGYVGPGASAMRAINDQLSWLYDALDVVTPSVYLGIPDARATTANSTIYVNSTVHEATRVARGKAVIAITWHHYDSYWLVPPPAPRPLLSPADSVIEFRVPLEAGAQGLLFWGAVRPGDDNTTEGATALQRYSNTTLKDIVASLCAADSALDPSFHCCDPSNGELCFF